MPNDIANNMADTIHQLERQLQTELDNSHCLEIEKNKTSGAIPLALDGG